MRTITRTWTDLKGKTIKVEGFVVEEKTEMVELFNDGWKSEVERKSTAKAFWHLIDGNERIHTGYPVTLTTEEMKKVPVGFTHKIGRMPLNAERLQMVNEVIDFVQNSTAAQQQHNQVVKEEENYKKQIDKTICPDCGTRCFGDCGGQGGEIEQVSTTKPKTRTQIMRRAWEIARAGAKKFGGSSKSFFAESLRQAWAEAKN